MRNKKQKTKQNKKERKKKKKETRISNSTFAFSFFLQASLYVVRKFDFALDKLNRKPNVFADMCVDERCISNRTSSAETIIQKRTCDGCGWGRGEGGGVSRGCSIIWLEKSIHAKQVAWLTGLEKDSALKVG